ncbi:hypothetical protein FGB62_236g08 [Gracilaria domingensis]|nr:hypothetical protein FGB62_236g08 [Gracilaria domingensis]
MGPEWKGRGGRRPFRLATAVRSKKPGEVPIYDERVDVRAYRRAVINCIKFQDLADKDSDRRLSLGQQVFAILGNIRGIASYRLAHISSMVYSEFTQEEFGQLVDYILNTIDPLDRETAFLDTAKAWKELMLKSQAKRQSFDEYWQEYSGICTQYAYAHGKVA